MAQLVDRHFKVMYRLPKGTDVVMDYAAPTLAAVMRNLQLTEGVNRDTVELLIVHEIREDGKIIEMVEVDKQSGKKAIIPINTVKKSTIITGEYDDDYEDGGQGLRWSDVGILNRVTELLTQASKTSKPRVTLRAVPSPDKGEKKLIKGYHFTAKPAVSL